jgi:hypothetical protein
MFLVIKYSGWQSKHPLPPKGCAVGEVDFWIFNFPQFAIDGKSNSKTKVEKVCFFIFLSSYAEMI